MVLVVEGILVLQGRDKLDFQQRLDIQTWPGETPLSPLSHAKDPVRNIVPITDSICHGASTSDPGNLPEAYRWIADSRDQFTEDSRLAGLTGWV